MSFDFPVDKDNTDGGAIAEHFRQIAARRPTSPKGGLWEAAQTENTVRISSLYLVIQMPKTTAQFVTFDNVPRMNDYDRR
jgi:hypothetical protein